MSNKQELLDRFATQTGAELPGVKKDSPTATGIELNLESVPPAQPTETLYKDSYSDRTQLKPWENPKYKGVIVGLMILPFTLGVAWIFKDGIPKPNLSSKAPPAPPPAQPENDLPKEASDGDWASYAATNGMRQQFAKANETDKVDALKQFQDKTKAHPTRTVPPGKTLPVTRAASVPTAPTRTYVAPPLRQRVAYSSPGYRSAFVRPLRPQTSAPSSGTGSPELTAEARRLAAINATSTVASGSDLDGAAPPANELTQDSLTTASSPASLTRQSPANGYQEAGFLASEAAVMEGVPQQLIHRSQKAEGRLLMGIAFTPGDSEFIQGQPVEIEIQDGRQSGLPNGSRIIATLDLPRQGGQSKNAVIRLVPTAIVAGDGSEYPLPEGSILLTGANGKPLVAKRQGSEFMRFLGETVQSTASGLGGLTSMVTGSNTGLLTSFPRQFSQNQEPMEVLALRENTKIQINVIKPLSLPESSF